MKELEFESLINLNSLIKGVDLIDKSDRTLLYGYTCDRSTFHVYIKDGEIKIVVYKTVGDLREIIPTCNSDYLPDKRVYPAKSDYEFCRRLMLSGCRPCFTYWEEDIPEQYYGLTL